MTEKKPLKPHPKAPRKLVTLWRSFQCNHYKTAQHLDIAPSWVWQLIKEGKEPKREDLRRKLFLTRKKSPDELEMIRIQKMRNKMKVDQEVHEYFMKIIGE